MGKINTNPITEMEQLASTIQEGTKNTLRDILSEAVSNYLREEVLNGDEEEQEEEVEEVNTPETETSDVEKFDETSDDAVNAEEAPEQADMAETAETDGDEWADFNDYKIGNDEGSEEYDFTKETDTDTLVKVFKLMKNDDQVSVVKNGDTVSIKDNENDTEYVIELDGDVNNEEEINDLTMTESLGYTDNYQSKDPIAGLTMSDGAKNTNDWHKGVPTGTEKPWAGKGNSKPYEKKTEKVFEITLNDDVEFMDDEEDVIDEAAFARGAVSDRSTTHTMKHTPTQKARNAHYNGKQVTNTADNPTLHTEALQRKINAAIQENKQLKQTVAKVSKIMKEAVQINVNLGHIVRLMVENTTTKAEKDNIVKRFSTVKSNEEAKALYESISSELNKTHSTIMTEQATTAESSKKINESKIYDEPNGVLDMMKRMNML